MMTDSMTLHASRWSTQDREPSAAFGFDPIASAPPVAHPADSVPVAGPRRHSPDAVTIAPPRVRRIGRIEQMALGARQLSATRSRILGILLEAADPERCGGTTILRPLWTNEAMHRADQMIRLTRWLDRRTSCAESAPAEIDLEWRIAKGLADALLSLRIARDDEKLPCSEVLRSVARDLVELFGEAAGISGISTSIERMELASFKRRALVLMAGHLVIEVLSFAARERRGGHVMVTLDRSCRGFGRLAVGYDDRAVPFGPLDGSHGVIDDLASLLESDVLYRADRWRIVAGVEFPLR
jgi:hypothetical protein